MHNINVIIPLAISPLERGDRFEDAICDLFDEDDGGDIVGGGTFGNEDKITGAHIQLVVRDFSLMNRIVAILREGGAPSESTIEFLDESKSVLLGNWVDVS